MKYEKEFRRAIEYVENHITEEIDYYQAAREECMSPYYFHRMFKTCFGFTIMEYSKTREDNLYDNATYTWSYDANGNITGKTVYPYCNDGITMPTGTVTYTYGNTDCKDLLTSYNGQTISYNGLYPTNWRGITGITWEGSKLTSFINSGNDRVYYTYDEDGHRILKNRCAVLTHYYWTDGKISGQSDYRGTLDFFYDGDDIKGFTYNNANFY